MSAAALLAGRCGGAVVGVWRAGRSEVWTWGERRPGEAVTEDAVFDLASVTKLATALACARAVEQGLLGWGSTVAELWDGPDGPGPGLATVTVEQLLRHRSGLPPWEPLYLLTDGPGTAVARILATPLRTAPGAAFCYSDLGLILLGALLARRCGAPLAELLVGATTEVAGRRVLHPGGADPALAVASATGDAVEREMVSTGVPYPVAAGARAEGFGWREELLVGRTADGNAFHTFGGLAGHAGAFASVPDLLALGAGLLTALGAGAGAAPAARGAAALLGAPVGGGAGGDGQSLGFRVREVGGTTAWWHPGFTGTALAVLPGRDAVLAVGTSRLLAEAPEPTTALFESVWKEVL